MLVLVLALYKTNAENYDLAALLAVASSFVFVIVVRLLDGYSGDHLISQNALALTIIFFMAAVFVRKRVLIYVFAVAVALTYCAVVGYFVLSGAMGNDTRLYVSKITTPLLLLSAIITLGVAIWTIFERTSGALRAQVEEIESAKTELARLNAKLEIKVEERSEQLMEKSRHELLDTMVAGLSHQLNTPLGSAMMMTSFIKSKLIQDKTHSPERERISEAVDLIERNLQRAIDLMTSYRQLGSFASDDPTVYTTIGPFFEHVRNNVESLLQGNPVAVSYDYDASIGVQVPMNHLHYVIIELVNNARIHADHEGQKILIQGQAKDGHLDLRVYNTGPSVPEDIRGKVMDPFFTTAGKEGRLGLGLSKVHTIVREVLRGSVVILEPREGWAFGVSVQVPGVYHTP